MKLLSALITATLCTQALFDVSEAVLCYSCQYSDGPGMVGYECVTSPADYTLGPNTVECQTGCQTEAQSINGWNSIWFLHRGCKTKPDGCSSGAAEICVETCDGPDLCNDKSHAPSTTPPGPTTTTTPSTTTTEAPGTRWCYSCQYSYNPDADDRCVTDAPNAPPPNIVRCPPDRVCTIFRQWDLGEKVVRSFRRGCDVDQGSQNHCTTDTFFETCLTYCKDEFCNSGDGTLPRSRGRDLRPLPSAKNG